MSRALREKFRDIHTRDDYKQLERLRDAANEVAKAWSGSNIGYHATVHYEGLEPPPPGAHFSAEWGFMSAMLGTRGQWREFNRDDLEKYIVDAAGIGELSALRSTMSELAASG